MHKIHEEPGRGRAGSALVHVMIGTILVAAAAQLSWDTLRAAVDASVAAREGGQARALAFTAEALLRAALEEGESPESVAVEVSAGVCGFTCSQDRAGLWRALCGGWTRSGFASRVELIFRRDGAGVEILRRTER